MFGIHVKVAESAGRLVITSPADLWMLLLFSVFTVWPLLIFVVQRPLPTRKVAFFALLTVLFYGYFIDCTRLTLDKATQQVAEERFRWFHWTRGTYPMANVAYAYLATGRGTDRLVLQYEDGGTQSLSVSNQMGGKPAAVLAINKFLGRTPAAQD